MWNNLRLVAIFVIAATMATGANADTKPALRMEFQVQESDLNTVKEILARYATEEGFALEDVGPHMPPRPKDSMPIFYVNLERPDSTEITMTNFLKPNQMLLFLYVPKQDAQSQHLMDPLISQLREKWPDIHVFTGI